MKIELFAYIVICFGIITTSYYIGLGLDQQYQLDQKYIKICHDFVNSGPTAISDKEEFCIWYDEMMRSTR